MAMDQFLKIGAIKGDSQAKGFESEISVLAWSWGGSNNGSAHMAQGAGSGKADVQDFSFTHYIDAASVDLQKFCSNGKHQDKAVLSVRKAGEDPLVYLKITMEDVLISSFSTGGSGGEDRLTENISLNFGKVTVEYTGQDNKGKAGKGSQYTFDIQKTTVS